MSVRSGASTAVALLASEDYDVFLIGNRLAFAKKHRLRPIYSVDHDNLNKLVGLCLNGPEPMVLWKYCERGSLEVLFVVFLNLPYLKGELKPDEYGFRMRLNVAFKDMTNSSWFH
ncbi:unnamed protein product [Gongylonema pulchrum]|uniref:Protein-serine/threonine phosphatase n=1 Tax=Gongylonema pulchrum TaxID=637853 RepID=A0A183EML0_9BILA|nr:unnamed protein product [Gongylonema pulchrum]